MAEDLSTYTKVDPNSKLTVTSAKVTAASLGRNETAYLVYDKGSNYFDGLDIDFEIKVSSLDSWGIIRSACLGNNSNGTFGSTDIICALYNPSAARIYFGAGYYGVSLSTNYYCTLFRYPGEDKVQLLVYSDSARTTLLATLEATGFGTTKWRYIYAIASQNTSSAIFGSAESGNFVINAEPTPPAASYYGQKGIANGICEGIGAGF